jgi:regulator of RNase E activity RraA
MDDKLQSRLEGLTTPHLADGCLRVNVPIRIAPSAVRPLSSQMRCSGPARPVRHVGSIDIFLEVFDSAGKGEILVIDNGGRADEACIGDIIALEARASGLSGIVIWGLHRDDAELRDIGFPVFSMGSCPTGPVRLHARPADVFTRAVFGTHSITADDFVVADSNGVLFLPQDRLTEIVGAAEYYRQTEARQLEAMRNGKNYRSQTRFADYRQKRERDPTYQFRQHLKDISGAGEA